MEEEISIVVDSFCRRMESLWAAHLEYINSTIDAIERGENINVQGAEGNTAVHIAFYDLLNWQLIQNLLRYQPNFNILNDLIQTPLHIYMKRLFLRSRKLESFLEKGADPNIPDADGNTCLHYLAKHPLPRVINSKLLTHTLLKYNAKVNIINNNGDTPLHLAVEHGAVDVITALLHTEVNVLIKNKENLTPMDLACTHKNNKPQVFIEIAKLAIILNNCKVPVNQEFLDIIHSNVLLRIFNEQCIEEVSRLKKIRVGNTNVTLNAILKSSTYDFAKHLRNSEILEWFSNFQSEKYKIFGCRINLHFTEGLTRMEAEEHGYLFCNKIFQTLPYVCHNKILTYLSNEDLYNLKWIHGNESEQLQIDEIPSD